MLETARPGAEWALAGVRLRSLRDGVPARQRPLEGEMTGRRNETDRRECLRIRGLSVDIAVQAGTLHAVRQVDLSVDRGETLAIVGESGCGKTITALAILRLLPRSATLRAEELSLEGLDLRGLSNREFSKVRGNRAGMIFQDPMTSLNPVYTIGSQLAESYLRHRGGGRKEALERAEYLLDRVGVANAAVRLSQYPHQLSGGLRQRMMIAMALMCDPSLIVADEPTTALDVTVQVQILRLLAELQAEFDMALVLISHDLGIVARTADRVAVMYAGQVVETGSSEQVFASPVHPYTQGLLDCIPHPGRRRGEPLGSIAGVVPTLIGRREGCMFRNRCPVAEDRCRRRGDELREADAGHEYRCVHDAGRLLSRTEA